MDPFKQIDCMMENGSLTEEQQSSFKNIMKGLSGLSQTDLLLFIAASQLNQTASIGSVTFEGLTDSETADLPAINNPLSIALGLLTPSTRTVNGQPLSADVSIINITGNAGTVSDIGNLTGELTSVNRVTTLSATGVTAGTYGSSSMVPTFQVDAKGRIIASGHSGVAAPAADITGTTLPVGITTAAGLSIGGNAATVTTNANLTGHVTSTGNAAVLGSFTLAQLSTAVSDANIARTDAAQSFAGVQTFANGSIAAPTIAFTTGVEGVSGFRYDGTNSINVVAQGTGIIHMGYQRFRIGSTCVLGWSSSQFNPESNAFDTGFYRNAAGVVEINNGTAGMLRDLKLRSTIQSPPSSITPAVNGELVFEATSNTSLTVKLKGTDGTVRSVVLTLAP